MVDLLAPSDNEQNKKSQNNTVDSKLDSSTPEKDNPKKNDFSIHIESLCKSSPVFSAAIGTLAFIKSQKGAEKAFCQFLATLPLNRLNPEMARILEACIEDCKADDAVQEKRAIQHLLKSVEALKKVEGREDGEIDSNGLVEYMNLRAEALQDEEQCHVDEEKEQVSKKTKKLRCKKKNTRGRKKRSKKDDEWDSDAESPPTTDVSDDETGISCDDEEQ